jgi:hypothetical protein
VQPVFIIPDYYSPSSPDVEKSGISCMVLYVKGFPENSKKIEKRLNFTFHSQYISILDLSLLDACPLG